MSDALPELARPGFRTPPHLRSDPLDPTATVTEGPPPASPEPSPSGAGPGRPEPSGPPASPASTRTSASPTDRGEIAAAMGKALVGLLTIAVAIATWLTQRPDGRRLRQPTRDDYHAVTKPLGRIGARHVPVDVAPAVVKSLLDAGEAAGGVSLYLTTGPLLEQPPAAPGPPAEEL